MSVMATALRLAGGLVYVRHSVPSTKGNWLPRQLTEVAVG